MVAPILVTLLPVFALMALGFSAVRGRFLDADDIRSLGRFVVGVALPALIFGAVAGAPLDATITPAFLLAYGGASLGVFAFGFWRARLAGAEAPPLQGLGMSFSNSGFIALPIGLTVLGDGAVRVLAQTMIVENLLILPLALALAEWDGRAGGGTRAALAGVARDLARNPILIGLMAGLVFAATGLPLPRVLAEVVRLLSGVAPVALFVVGGMVAATEPGRPTVSVGWIVGGKLLLHPAAVLGALLLAPEVDPLLVAGGILFASVPMLSIYPILGQRYGADRLTATAMVVATVASLATLAAVLAGLGALDLLQLAR
jgi:malonate transporter and related proteins